MSLIRLPNGSWISPSTVTAVVPLPTGTGHSGTLHRARVVIHHGRGQVEVLQATDDLHAQEMADNLATAFNP